MKITKIVVGFLVILVLILLWLVFKPGLKQLNAPTKTTTESAPAPEISSESELTFQEKGNLVFDKGLWYLLYKEPGAPAVRLRLQFDESTICELGAVEGCNLKRIKSGSRIEVSGIRSGNKLRVKRLSLEDT